MARHRNLRKKSKFETGTRVVGVDGEKGIVVSQIPHRNMIKVLYLDGSIQVYLNQTTYLEKG